MKIFLTIINCCILPIFLLAQEIPAESIGRTFKDTRIINTHSTEGLAKRKLDIRIGHRFGDLKDGWETLYGLENAADVLIGADYGITNKLMVGLNRTKGGGPLTALINTTVKYKLLGQKAGGGSPLSLSLLFVNTISTLKKVDNPESLAYFEKFQHRMSYTFQALIARKFADALSFQLTPAYTYRNLVNYDDSNGMFSLGIAMRVQITKVLGLIADAAIPFSALRNAENGYYFPLGVGLEIDTGGHIFQINLTNARGMVATDYLPYTKSNWLDGEFRLGFTISRTFNL